MDQQLRQALEQSAGKFLEQLPQLTHQLLRAAVINSLGLQEEREQLKLRGGTHNFITSHIWKELEQQLSGSFSPLVTEEIEQLSKTAAFRRRVREAIQEAYTDTVLDTVVGWAQEQAAQDAHEYITRMSENLQLYSPLQDLADPELSDNPLAKQILKRLVEQGELP